VRAQMHKNNPKFPTHNFHFAKKFRLRRLFFPAQVASARNGPPPPRQWGDPRLLLSGTPVHAPCRPVINKPA
jgi:hypothetical protein